jgi:perosamine synthetase
LLAIAKRHNLYVIEDAAEAHGLTYKGRPCGSFGDITAVSFYANKLVTTGEGGMVLTDDPALAERSRYFRNLCFQSKRRFVHEEIGWNYRMASLQAALGIAQVEKLDETMRLKRRIGARYTALLGQTPELAIQPGRTDVAESIYWVFGCVLADYVPFDAEEMMQRLAAKGIGTRPFFWPIHEQPVLHRMGLCKGEHHPVSERIARRGFYVPTGVGITDAQIDRCAAAVKECLAS